MDAHTRSSKRAPNARARASLLLGLVAVAALPAAIAVANTTDEIELLDAAVAIPVAALAGLASILLARGARRRIERTIGRVGGERLALAGRLLGVLGLCFAVSAAISVTVYEVLIRLE